MKRFYTIFIAFLPFFCMAQKVQIQLADTLINLPAQQTQTEVKSGWKIVDIQLKDKVTHYLPGTHSMQLTDDGFPTFHIIPSEKETLAEYAIVRLRSHKGFRWFPKPKLSENKCLHIDLSNFDIRLFGNEDGFLCHPFHELEKGDYMILNTNQKPVGELGDYVVYTFLVP